MNPDIGSAATGALVVAIIGVVVYLVKRGWKGATQDVVTEHEEKRTQDILERLRSELKQDIQEAVASFSLDNSASHNKLHTRIDGMEERYHQMDKNTSIAIAEVKSKQEAYQKDIEEVRGRLASMDSKIDSVLRWAAGGPNVAK